MVTAEKQPVTRWARRSSSSFITELKYAVERVEQKEGKKILDHFVERAFQDDTVLIALMRKLLPDLKAGDLNISGELTIANIMKLASDKLKSHGQSNSDN